MIERTPVVRHEVARTQLVEQPKRIVGTQVSPTKARFPPWGIPYRKQGEVEITSTFVNHLADHSIGIRHQPGVASEETRLVAGVEQIHVRRASPSVYRITAAFVLCRRCVNGHVSDHNLPVGRERPRM